MARKKRIPEVAPPTSEAKPKVQYQDPFQAKVGQKLEEAGKKFEGKGKTILYAVAALAVLAILVGIFYAWNRRSNAQAQAALGKAIETSQAMVTDSPVPAGSNIKTFKTEKERAEAAINEFQAVVDKHGGDVAQKARYFIAVNRLVLDRAAGTQELENLTKSNDEVGRMAKFALAQVRAADGQLDQAIALYRELAAMDNPIVAKETINFQLAQLLEKQGKKDEAADIYYNIAKTASEAKDLEGKAVPMTQTARQAREKLEELSPERAKEIQEPAP